jgi:hypothetical protein
MDDVRLAGASAGALTATLTATGVDFYRATELALDLSKEAGVWDRSGGLQGVWGAMIETWLEELLPEDALQRVENRVSSSLTLLEISLYFSLILWILCLSAVPFSYGATFLPEESSRSLLESEGSD